MILGVRRRRFACKPGWWNKPYPAVSGAATPAPGCRLALPNVEGIPGGVGDNGYSWAANANDINGMLFEFRMQFLIPNYAVSRSYGFQLRCLSE